MKFTAYEVTAGVWSFDAPLANPLAAPWRVCEIEAPADAYLVRVKGEALVRCRVNGADKLVSAGVAVSCARRGLHGFRVLAGDAGR